MSRSASKPMALLPPPRRKSREGQLLINSVRGIIGSSAEEKRQVYRHVPDLVPLSGKQRRCRTDDDEKKEGRGG